MKYINDPERINKRCKILEGYGFTIVHEDSNVLVYGVEVDFSAIDTNTFLYYAFSQVQKQSFKEGRNSIRKEFNQLLTLENE